MMVDDDVSLERLRCLLYSAPSSIAPSNIAPSNAALSNIALSTSEQSPVGYSRLPEVDVTADMVAHMLNKIPQDVTVIPEGPSSLPPTTTQIISKRNKRKRVETQQPESTTGFRTRAMKIPADKKFAIGLPRPLFESLAAGGPELNSLKNQKLIDATYSLQDSTQHILEPLTLYNKSQLYELMASIAEAWKNSGKSALRKRINKIKENATNRKPPRNGLDEKEIEEIERLSMEIEKREEWESKERRKIQEKKKLRAEQKKHESNI